MKIVQMDGSIQEIEPEKFFEHNGRKLAVFTQYVAHLVVFDYATGLKLIDYEGKPKDHYNELLELVIYQARQRMDQNKNYDLSKHPILNEPQ